MAADLVVVPSGMFAPTAARYIAEAMREAAARAGVISLALSGGKSPGPVYRELAEVPGLPWNRVAIYFADERGVPPEDAESNYRLVQVTLLAALAERVAAVHRMEADRSDLDRAAQEYAAALPAALDILVLGLGEDGHTASLFPHHPAAGETRRRVVAVDGPSSPRRRMTITPPVIRSARVMLMLAAGRNKAAAVARARLGPDDPIACPAQLARHGTWILDQQAASQLRTAG